MKQKWNEKKKNNQTKKLNTFARKMQSLKKNGFLI